MIAFNAKHIRQAWRTSSNTLSYFNCVRSRSLWTRVSSTAPTLKACLDQCLINASKQTKEHPPTVCFALLSKSFQFYEYEEAVSYLSERFGDIDKTAIMGCIVDRTATESGHGVNLLIGYGEAIKPFQVVDGPKRQKVRTISVGRWGHVHDFDRLKYQDNTLDTLGWQSFQTISQPPQQRLDVFRNECDVASGSPKSQQQRKEEPSVIFMASDQEPDQVLQSLDQEYPNTPKLGVIAASTPFVTGSAYTLFYQGQLMNAGMVGFASYSPTPLFSSVSVRYPYLEPLGPHFTITRARGNIILDLDDQGATRMLINLINEVNSSKDEAFYLAMYSDDGNQQKREGGGKLMVARITSGDPSRGNMAVDTTLDLKIGQKVQFMRRKALDTPFDSQGLLDCSEDNVMTLGVVDLDHTIDAQPMHEDSSTFSTSDNERWTGDTFGATSENGIIIGEPGCPSQLLQVPFTSVIVK